MNSSGVTNQVVEIVNEPKLLFLSEGFHTLYMPIVK